jgi:uncharacterized protein YjbI with pentapeptide repeats
MSNQRTPQTPGDWGTANLAGQTFVVTGLRGEARGTVIARIESAGGTVVADVTPSLHFLVVPEADANQLSAAETKARRLIQQGARLRILTPPQLAKLLAPTPEQVLAMLHAGAEGIAHWNALSASYRNVLPVNLRGADFRGRMLVGAQLAAPRLARADFRTANLTRAWFSGISDARCEEACLADATIHEAARCNFAGANLAGASVMKVKGCNFARADLTGAHGSYGFWSRCDCSGARMARFSGTHMRTAGAVFRGADLTAADLPDATLTGADFSAADLTGADLSNSHLKRAVLVRAKLSGAVLAGAKLAGADLTGADLRGASLANVDLRQVRIDGADFTGAHLIATLLTGVDTTRAVGLSPAVRPGGHPSQAAWPLREFAQGCTSWLFGFDVEVPGGLARLSFWGHGYHHFAEASLGARRLSHSCFSMHELLEHEIPRWLHGTFRPESVTVEGRGSPLSAAAQRQVVLNACCEAFGIEPPPAEEQARKEPARTAQPVESGPTQAAEKPLPRGKAPCAE